MQIEDLRVHGENVDLAIQATLGSIHKMDTLTRRTCQATQEMKHRLRIALCDSIKTSDTLRKTEEKVYVANTLRGLLDRENGLSIAAFGAVTADQALLHKFTMDVTRNISHSNIRVSETIEKAVALWHSNKALENVFTTQFLGSIGLKHQLERQLAHAHKIQNFGKETSCQIIELIRVLEELHRSEKELRATLDARTVFGTQNTTVVQIIANIRQSVASMTLSYDGIDVIQCTPNTKDSEPTLNLQHACDSMLFHLETLLSHGSRKANQSNIASLSRVRKILSDLSHVVQETKSLRSLLSHQREKLRTSCISLLEQDHTITSIQEGTKKYNLELLTIRKKNQKVAYKIADVNLTPTKLLRLEQSGTIVHERKDEP